MSASWCSARTTTKRDSRTRSSQRFDPERSSALKGVTGSSPKFKKGTSRSLSVVRLLRANALLCFRAIRAVKILARDRRIPRGLRWLAVLGLLPIPGPLDEGVLLIVAGLLAVFYPDRMRDAWRLAANDRFATPF